MTLFRSVLPPSPSQNRYSRVRPRESRSKENGSVLEGRESETRSAASGEGGGPAGPRDPARPRGPAAPLRVGLQQNAELQDQHQTRPRAPGKRRCTCRQRRAPTLRPCAPGRPAAHTGPPAGGRPAPRPASRPRVAPPAAALPQAAGPSASCPVRTSRRSRRLATQQRRRRPLPTLQYAAFPLVVPPGEAGPRNAGIGGERSHCILGV